MIDIPSFKLFGKRKYSIWRKCIFIFKFFFGKNCPQIPGVDLGINSHNQDASRYNQTLLLHNQNWSCRKKNKIRVYNERPKLERPT